MSNPVACFCGATRWFWARTLTTQNKLEYDLPMIRYRYFFAVFLLVMSLVLTSGITAAAMEFLQAGSATACCDFDVDSESTPFDAPCSEPSCQCISCLTFVAVYSRQPVYSGFHSTFVFNSLTKAPPHEYFNTIDYPPELS